LAVAPTPNAAMANNPLKAVSSMFEIVIRFLICHPDEQFLT
jgi:hypothetical protein